MSSMARRSVRLGGRNYPVILPSLKDPRLQVAAVLLTVQVLGQTVLNFRLSIAQILVCLLAGALIEFAYSLFKDKVIMWPASGLLTGNSTAFIFRVPGTLHGDWWSTRGIGLFIAVVAIGMASKYLIRWRGRHIFNPSNLALVLAFVVLGPRYTEPQDLWWIPMGPWLVVTYAILIGGGLAIGWRIGLFGMQLAYMAGFGLSLALALVWQPDHCMVATWRATPMCGSELWQVITASPELIVFAFFMVPDPRTVPEGRAARVAFGLATAVLSVLLIGPTGLEYWTKTAILAALVVTCGLRSPIAALLSRRNVAAYGDRLAPALAIACVLGVALLPASSGLSTHGPDAVAELTDGTVPTIRLTVGSGPDPANWADLAAAESLPQQGNPGTLPLPQGQTSRVWQLPPLPPVTVPANVIAFAPYMTTERAQWMVKQAVLDLVIEAEARRTQDAELAGTAATDDGLKPFTSLIANDRAAGQVVATTYVFSHVGLVLYLPAYAGQAPQLLGVAVSGTVTYTITDRSGVVLRSEAPYSSSWALDDQGCLKTCGAASGRMVITTDYTGLTPAP